MLSPDCHRPTRDAEVVIFFFLGIEGKERTSYSACLCELKCIKQGLWVVRRKTSLNRRVKLLGGQLNEAVEFQYGQ